MSANLNVGDAVLVEAAKNNESIGLVKYIGPLVDNMMTEHVGIELVEPIKKGHDGTINNFTYFTTKHGHGFHCKLSDIIRKLSASELISKLREQYEYIQKLEAIITNTNTNTYRKTTTLTLTDRPSQRYHTPRRYSYSLESNKTFSKRQSLSSIMTVRTPKTPKTPKMYRHPNIYSYPISIMDPKTSLVTESRTETAYAGRQNSTSIMTEMNSTTASSSDTTDHECSLSSSPGSSSDAESQEIQYKQRIFIERRNRKRNRKKRNKKEKKKVISPAPKPNRRKRSESVSISTSSNGRIATSYPIPRIPFVLAQSHTELLSGSNGFTYNEPSHQPLNGYMAYTPIPYIKYNEYSRKKLPSLSQMSKTLTNNTSKTEFLCII